MGVCISAISMDLSYRYSAGQHFTFFFDQLKHKKIFGVECPQCHEVFVPPRPFCGSCKCNTGDWVAVGPQGTIEARSEIFLPILDPGTGKMRKVPHLMVLVRLDGASCALHHVLLEDNAPEAQIGRRVDVVFVNEPVGAMKDILGFRLLPKSAPDASKAIPSASDILGQRLSTTQAAERLKEIPPLVVEGHVHIPFSYTLGEVAQKFFAFWNAGSFKTLRCDDCGEVHFPPVRFCPHCISQNQSWVELSPQGSLIAAVYWENHPPPQAPSEALGFGLVKLDGQKFSFLHYLMEARLAVGDRVKLKGRSVPSGTIMDFGGFIRE